MNTLQRVIALTIALALVTVSSCVAAGSSVPPSQTAKLSPEGQAAFNFGLTAVRQQNWKIAIRYFLDAQKTDPNASQVWYNLGLACAKQPGYEFRAIAWFKAYLLANPNAPNASAIRAEIAQLEIIYESRLTALIDPLESVARALVAGQGTAADPLTLARLGSMLAVMRLDLGDSSGAARTVTLFGVAPLYTVHQTSVGAHVDEAGLIALGRNGFGSLQLSADFDDTSLDQYMASLKQDLLAPSSGLTPDQLLPAVTNLAALFDSYRRMRDVYGPVHIDIAVSAAEIANSFSGTLSAGAYTYTTTTHLTGCAFSISYSSHFVYPLANENEDSLWAGDLGDIDPSSVKAWNAGPSWGTPIVTWGFSFSSKSEAPPFSYQGYAFSDSDTGHYVFFVGGTDLTSLVTPFRALVLHCSGSHP